MNYESMMSIYIYNIKYFMQGDSETLCPKCGQTAKYSYPVFGAFTNHLCYNACGYQFWTLKICPHCERPEKTIFLNKPKFGEKIQCTNCNHSMYYFRCPNKNCLELYYKDANFYTMGSNVTCVQCNQTYKFINCSCGGTTVLPQNQTVFEGYTLFNCKCCKKDFTFTVCPACQAPEYHLDKLDVGDRIRCTTCKLWRKYVPCPKCGKTLRGDRFSFCQPNKCFNCEIVFQYSKCPYGCSGFNFNILNKPPGPIRFCFQCKKNYSVINCRKCEQSLYLEKIDKGIGIVDFCPHCKTIMKYYHCPACNEFNSIEPTCFNAKCPKPTSIIDNTVEKKKQPEKKKEEAENGEEQQCKICFSEKAEVINETCSHLMMCQTCLRSCQQKSRGANVPCPICKQIGRYYTYKKPIYS